MIPTSLSLPPLQHLARRQSECLFSIISHVVSHPDRPDRVAHRADTPYFVVSRRTGLGREAIVVVYRCTLVEASRWIVLGDGKPHRGNIMAIEVVSITTLSPGD